MSFADGEMEREDGENFAAFVLLNIFPGDEERDERCLGNRARFFFFFDSGNICSLYTHENSFYIHQNPCHLFHLYIQT